MSLSVSVITLSFVLVLVTNVRTEFVYGDWESPFLEYPIPVTKNVEPVTSATNFMAHDQVELSGELNI